MIGVGTVLENRYGLAAVILGVSLLIGFVSGLSPQILLITAAAGLLLYFAVFRLFGFYLFAVMLYPILPQYIGVEVFGRILINPQRLLLSVLFAAWIIDKRTSGDGVACKTPVNAAIWLFLAARLLSIPFSLDIRVSAFRYVSELLTYVLSFFITVDIVRTKARIHRVVDVLLLSGLLISLLGLIEFFFGANVFASLDPVRPDYRLTASVSQFRLGFLRVEAGFGHSLLMGQFMCLLLPLSLGRAKTSAGWKRFVFLFLSVLMGAVIVVTFSRSAWVGLTLILILYFAKTRKGSLLPVLGLLCVLVLVALILFPRVSLMFRQSIDLEGGSEIASSSSFRVEQIRTILPKISRRPLTGYGIGKSREASGLSALDNYYLSILLESGIPSLILFLLIPVVVLSSLFRLAGNTRDETIAIQAWSFSVSVLTFFLLLAAISLTHLFFLCFVLMALGVRLALTERGAY